MNDALGQRTGELILRPSYARLRSPVSWLRHLTAIRPSTVVLLGLNMTGSEQSAAEAAAFGLAAGAVYRDVAIVSALGEADVIDPLKVAA